MSKNIESLLRLFADYQSFTDDKENTSPSLSPDTNTSELFEDSLTCVTAAQGAPFQNTESRTVNTFHPYKK